MQDESLKNGDTVGIIDTSLGVIKVKFFTDFTPKACENFITHSINGYYDGTIFHRVIAEFMIQGGDPEGTGMGGDSIYGHEFEDERVEGFKYTRGALCMANSGPNTNGSQFFIYQAKQVLNLQGFYTTFGHVVEGMDIVDKIALQRVGRNDRPIHDIVINGIDIKTYKDGELVEYSK